MSKGLLEELDIFAKPTPATRPAVSQSSNRHSLPFPAAGGSSFLSDFSTPASALTSNFNDLSSLFGSTTVPQNHGAGLNHSTSDSQWSSTFTSAPPPKLESHSAFNAILIRPDVATDEDFDDFDNFEFAPPAKAVANPNVMFDAFDNATLSPPAPRPMINHAASNDFGFFADAVASTPQRSPQMQSQSADDFGDFIYTPRIPTPPPQVKPFHLAKPLENANYAHPSSPPSTIAALMQHLSVTFILPTPFLNSLKGLPYAKRQRVLSNPRTKIFFTGVAEIARVAGRIIAGRKKRGKRHTSKGLSSTTSNKGMKDEREVREAVRIWEDTVGGMRAAMVGMGVTLPDLDAEMSATGGGGGAVGVKKDEGWCWLCCLGRMEVVRQLKEIAIKELERGDDGRWVNGWGHKGCRNWWEENGKKIKE